MSLRVYIAPDYSKKPSETGGIRRVVDAQVRYLPDFDIEVVHNPSEAEIICNHGGMLVSRPGVPMVHTGHGLYWSRQPWGDGYQDVNKEVIESMCQSVAHTVPSQWVADAVRRGGLFYPTVIYHGVDTEEFRPSASHKDYVVWAKARADYVSNPDDMLAVAGKLPNRKFVSTVGEWQEGKVRQPANVTVTGSLPYEKMHKLVAEASVYLSTARETFGIGTLEALACGVPVAGWDCGGNSEIIKQGETGYLAPWGDFDALAECIEKCYAEREKLSVNCIEDARTRWQWKPRIAQYADIFWKVYRKYYERADKPRVSVIVATYKLDKYLPACLQSICTQSYRDFECIVVDDAQLASTEAIVRAVSEQDKRVRYIPTPQNLKLSGTRNFGFSQANGLFIRHMDADDILAENALELEVNALERDNSIHIAYGHLEVINEDGSRRLRKDGQPERCGWPPEQFNWYQQMSHLNQLPSTVMVRREVYERSGGYRERMRRNEDAEFWCRVTSLGFRAKKITQVVTMYHREREDSKGALEWKTEGQEKDWTAWFPWRTGANNYSDGIKKYRENGDCHPLPHLVPFAAQSSPGRLRWWYVHDYSYPVVSVIVTCGPGHEQYLLDALDSVQAQTYPDWECLVVNDTGKPWGTNIAGAPFVKVINMNGNEGTSKARNTGYQFARGRYIVWLDADDYWLPWFLERLVAYAEQNYGVIYPDLIKLENENGKEKYSIYTYPEFDCERVQKSMVYPGTSVLYPRSIVQSVFDFQEGYDLEIPGMEDWDFQSAIHTRGFCAYHVEEPLFVYRTYSSTKREKDYNRIDEIKSYMDAKWSMFRRNAMGCGCGSKKKVSTMPTSTLSSSGNFDLRTAQGEVDLSTQMVNVEYVGPIKETFSIRSRVDPGISYRFGNNDHHRIRAVFVADAEYLAGSVDGAGKPFYRILSSGNSLEIRDPSLAIGAPIG